MINHSASYGFGENHTNTIENAFSLLKSGIYGTFHKVSIKHLGCNEFSYRFNRRGTASDVRNDREEQCAYGAVIRQAHFGKARIIMRTSQKFFNFSLAYPLQYH
jgi:hypothetical protein